MVPLVPGLHDLSLDICAIVHRPPRRACVCACPCGACHVTRARAFLPQALSYTVFFPQKAIPPPLWLVAVELFITALLSTTLDYFGIWWSTSRKMVTQVISSMFVSFSRHF